MIMVILGFAQADNLNLPFIQVESNSESINVSCASKCELICAPLIEIVPAYFVCLNNRNKRCPQMFVAIADNCLTDCGLIKFIDVNIDIYNYSIFIIKLIMFFYMLFIINFT